MTAHSTSQTDSQAGSPATTPASMSRAQWTARPLAWREGLRAQLEALTPRQRQYALLAVLLCGGVGLLWLVFSLSRAAEDGQRVPLTTQGKTSVTNVGVLPPGAQLNPVDQWVGTAGRKLAQYETEREEQGRLNKDRQGFEARTMQRFAELEQRLTSAQQGALAAASTSGMTSISLSMQSAQTPQAPRSFVSPAALGSPASAASPASPSSPSLPPGGLPPLPTIGAAVPSRPIYPSVIDASGMPPGTPSDFASVQPSDSRPGTTTSATSFPGPFANSFTAPVISRVSLGAGSGRGLVQDESTTPDAPRPQNADSADSVGNTDSSQSAQGVQNIDDDENAHRARSRDARTVATFLPVSFTRGVLLGGLDAPTGGQAQSNPQPVLIRLSDNSVLPNQFRGEYRDCFVVAAGYGDISAERAYLRTENLSCVRDDGATLEVRIQGTVYGEDGKVGMRGRLVTKQGQMLANALLAGVVSGIGQGLSTANTSYSSSPLGTTASTDSSADAYRAGIGSGVGKALDRLAQYYIKLAENTFPVIEVDAGREIDVVITRGVRIDVPMSGNPRTPLKPGADARSVLNGTRGAAPPSGRFAAPESRYLEASQDERN